MSAIKATKKSGKLFVFVKMAEEHGGGSINIKVNF